MKHLMALEEKDGYMTDVLESRPELAETVAALRAEHLQFRKSLRGILARLNGLSPNDHDGLAEASSDLTMLLDRLEAHGKKETDLLQEALLTDEGGEG